ncbi:M-phase phosphoprotein 9 [Galemys pyrenaicus]|uniref:M-phase phosphoprotein 9 n=1 Tax=Galemys pyrenaicus TaxID=202257 RepID=A0A8J6AD44_GALPY|nr:M-phase phosphoprotein 9 [Galemys pyrenaicus]
MPPPGRFVTPREPALHSGTAGTRPPWQGRRSLGSGVGRGGQCKLKANQVIRWLVDEHAKEMGCAAPAGTRPGSDNEGTCHGRRLCRKSEGRPGSPPAPVLDDPPRTPGKPAQVPRGLHLRASGASGRAIGHSGSLRGQVSRRPVPAPEPLTLVGDRVAVWLLGALTWPQDWPPAPKVRGNPNRRRSGEPAGPGSAHAPYARRGPPPLLEARMREAEAAFPRGRRSSQRANQVRQTRVSDTRCGPEGGGPRARLATAVSAPFRGANHGRDAGRAHAPPSLTAARVRAPDPDRGPGSGGQVSGRRPAGLRGQHLRCPARAGGPGPAGVGPRTTSSLWRVGDALAATAFSRLVTPARPNRGARAPEGRGARGFPFGHRAPAYFLSSSRGGGDGLRGAVAGFSAAPHFDPTTTAPSWAGPRTPEIIPRCAPRSPILAGPRVSFSATRTPHQASKPPFAKEWGDQKHFDLVKTLPKTSSSVESDIKNSPHSLGLNLSTNRSSPHLSTNGVSSFSGKTRPSVIQGTVEVLSSFMQELQDGGKTDSELWKNSETSWLQLFTLVEKQCQEQIVTQQEQFHGQVQRIQEEIRNLVKLQTSNASWASFDSSLSSPVSSESPMGFFSENSKRNESVISSPKSREPEMEQEAAAPQPDCSADGSSVSSGYGTFSVSELHTCKSEGREECTEHGEGALALQAQPRPEAARAKSCHMRAADDFCAPAKEDSDVSHGEFEHTSLGEKISEVYSGKTRSKSVTSWAEKLKQNPPKRAPTEDSTPAGGSELARTPARQSEDTAAARPRAFYLCEPEGRPQSWTSDSGAGPACWALEESHARPCLPRTSEEACVPPSEALPASQFNSGNEMTLPSLKEIYHKKQRENERLPERNLPAASSPGHPPEVLTLDPTIHMKPWQRGAGTPPPDFGSALEARTAFSPDSVLEPSTSSHSDVDSCSQASHVASQLPGFPRYRSRSKALPVNSWKTLGFQNESGASSPFPSACTIAASDVSVNTVEDGDAATATVASVSPCQLPGTAGGAPGCVSLTALEDPVIMSKYASQGPACAVRRCSVLPAAMVRQNLKEKHARHVADLRAYYESEISSLKQKLEAKEASAVEEWKKANQILVDRCGQLDIALNEATSRVRTLESKNTLLEMEVSDFRERFSAASSASKILQERIEEMRTSNKEKDNTILRLKSRLQGLEEAFENAYKLSDDKEARLKQENKMFHDLLGEYESLGREHERVKDTLNTTENKLLDAHTQVSDLKRTISKLEAQVKQVEHENMLSLRHESRAPTRPSRANREHAEATEAKSSSRAGLTALWGARLEGRSRSCAGGFRAVAAQSGWSASGSGRAQHTSPCSTLATSDVGRRKWLIPGAEYSIFTGQPLDAQAGSEDPQLEQPCAPGHRSHPEKESLSGISPTSLLIKKQRENSDTPIMKALKEFNEEKIFKNWGTQTEKESTSHKLASPRQTGAPVSAARSPEQCAQQRPKRLSSASPRSSSLPPSNRKPSTPTKREIMLTPVTVAYSPKRSPKENMSPGFSHLLSKNENSPVRFDILLDDLDPVPVTPSQCPNPRKQLQFLLLADSEEKQYSEKATAIPGDPGCLPETPVPSAWEWSKLSSCVPCRPELAAHGGDFEYTAKIRTLAETERFFDELTKEKDQIEAALSRLPSAGGRATLQTRLSREALEDRLERINRELGSVRMTLKKFHVLRTSANL